MDVRISTITRIPNEHGVQSSVDIPKAGESLELPSIRIAGWVGSQSTKINAVCLLQDGRLLHQAAVKIKRPDVHSAFPDLVNQDMAGFDFRVGILGMASSFNLELVAMEPGWKRKIPIARIEGNHDLDLSDSEARIQPLLVTGLARSGSTWLMRLLSVHPEITVFDHYPYECRAGIYWMHAAKVLSEPAELETSKFDAFMDDMLSVRQHPMNQNPYKVSPGVREFFRFHHPKQVARFCVENTQRFYECVARDNGIENPKYFAEKSIPSHIAWVAGCLYSRRKEIILVRDLRDVFCSVRAFNQKRGFQGFGREGFQNDEQYVRSLAEAGTALTDYWKQRDEIALLVRYEDLISRPESEIQRILDYLDLDSSGAAVTMLLERAQDTDELRFHRTSQNAADSIGRWSKELPPDQQAAFTECLKAPLETFGYPLQPGQGWKSVLERKNGLDFESI